MATTPNTGIAGILGSSTSATGATAGLSPEAYYSNTTPPTFPALGAATVPPSGVYSVSIAGHNYTVDTSFEPYRREAYRHKSIVALRESLNFDNSAGEGVVNTQGLWRRSAQNWVLGAGQKFFDFKKSSPDRYFTSKGINPWTEFQLSLLYDTTKAGSLGYSASGTMVNVMTAGTYTYYLESNVLKFRSTPGGALTTVTGLPTATGTVKYTSITHNGSYWYVSCQTGGIYYGALGVTAATGQWVKPNASFSVTGATYGGGNVTYTTSTTHTFNVGDYVSVTGLNTAWNVSSQIITAITSTTFTIVLANPGGSSGSGGTATPINNCAGFGLVQWTADRLWAAGGPSTASYSGPYLLAFQSNHTAGTTASTNDMVTPGIASGAVPNTVGSHGVSNAAVGSVPVGALGPTWIWTGIAAGASQIYACGYNLINGMQSDGAVYRTSIDNTPPSSSGSFGPMPSGYTYPAKALPISPGEYPTALYGYLNYMFLGTNLGVRMCQTLNAYDPNATASGDLKSGPIVPGVNQTVSQPVTAFVGYKQYVWFTWSNYDITSTGLGRLDLTNFIDDLAPAYASDLMITGQGTLTLDWDYTASTPATSYTQATSGAPLICLTGSGGGVYQQSSSLVSSGSIVSGWMSWDIPENKVALYTRLIAPGLVGTASVSVSVDYGSPTFVGTFALTDTPNTTAAQNVMTINNGIGLQGKLFNYTMVLQPSGAQSPVINRWQLDALPQVASETNITAIIQLYAEALVDGTQDYKNPYGEYVYLDNLRRAQTPVWYVEGPLSAQVIVESIDWLPEKPRSDYVKGFHALAVVTMKTLNGFATPVQEDGTQLTAPPF